MKQKKLDSIDSTLNKVLRDKDFKEKCDPLLYSWLEDMHEIKMSIDETRDLIKAEQNNPDEMAKMQERQGHLQRAFIEKWANMPNIKIINNK